ncbi:hypothetical protein NHX12_021659 [Muraenolepis orangiensis]|uniref:Uncharacterized protein n=1 Tax=Muraenolepis orangiensis TaxID=630683 RepID=A0A9Q0EQT0_9TELE|nr:hypothetical protein NHX12_021659 [Muraenolepis orangiensis]
MVAQKNYEPELPPLPDDLDEDEDSVKIIRLVKNKEPLDGVWIRLPVHRSPGPGAAGSPPTGGELWFSH